MSARHTTPRTSPFSHEMKHVGKHVEAAPSISFNTPDRRVGQGGWGFLCRMFPTLHSAVNCQDGGSWIRLIRS